MVKRNKTDGPAAAAIGKGLRQPDRRFAAPKSAEQQAVRGLERGRERLVKQHTRLGNGGRRQLAERGLVATEGRRGFAQLAEFVARGRWILARRPARAVAGAGRQDRPHRLGRAGLRRGLPAAAQARTSAPT